MFEKKENKLLLAAVGFCLFFNRPVLTGHTAEDPLQPHVQARLISENRSIKPGLRFWVAVWLKMDDGWHTYWKNPGDSGLPTSVEWVLPEGFIAGDIHWPYPHKFETSGLVNFGYEGEVFLLTEIKPPASLRAGTIAHLSAGVDWLVCREECIPGHAELTLELPVMEKNPELDAKWTEHFKNTRKKLPVDLNRWTITAALDKDKILVRVFPFPLSDRKIRNFVFFPEQEGLVEYSKPQIVKEFDSGYLIEIEKSKTAVKIPSRLKGVLYTPQGWGGLEEFPALRLDVPLYEKL
jgi:DsbC/DsbD-like thiol-disulfide interchange protein